MKLLALVTLLLVSSLWAEESEADLQQPVSDMSQMSRQEQQETPTIDQVEISKEPQKPAPFDQKKFLQEKVNHSKPWTSY